jgi:hypothetical protein
MMTSLDDAVVVGDRTLIAASPAARTTDRFWLTAWLTTAIQPSCASWPSRHC